LRPLAGSAAYLLFTVGLIGTGILGVPVLTGCSACVVEKTAAWRRTLEDRPLLSRKFSNSIEAAMLLELVLNFVGFNAVEMLFYSAVLNGLLAPPLILLVVLLTSKSERLKRRGKVSENPNKEKGNG